VSTDHPDEERPAALAAFAQAYTRRIPEDEFPTIPPEQLFAEIEGAFGFLDSRGAEPLALRVFTPTLERNGYESPGSVAEIVTDDSPFLVDSVMAVFARQGLQVVRHFHPVVGTVRGDDGELVDVVSTRGAARRESFQHYELNLAMDDEGNSALEHELAKVLIDVQVVVRDFEPLKASVAHMIEYVREGAGTYSDLRVEEYEEFLEWLLDLNFIFLGYREYEVAEVDGEPAASVVPGSGLGILSDDAGSQFSKPVPLSEMPEDLRGRFEEGLLLVVTKSNRHATVHRDSKMDFISVRRVDASGKTVGEARLLGLFTSKAYMAEAATIPILRRKLETILDAEDLIEGSHDYKLLVQIFESFPKDELFAIPEGGLRRSLLGLLESEEHQSVRLFIRSDLLKRNVSLLVVVPRGRFDADLRRSLQNLFLERFQGSTVDYRLSLGETGDARIHFTVWVEGLVPDVPFHELERDVLALTRTWEDRVTRLLAETIGEKEARRRVNACADRFPDSYRSATPLRRAVSDINYVDRLLGSEERLLVGIHNDDSGEERVTRIVVYSRDGKRDLSAMLPLLEDLGLRILEEIPTGLIDGDEEVFIHDFGALGPDGACLDTTRCGERVAAALAEGLEGRIESDSLNRLIVTTGLRYQQVNILRAYRSYWRLLAPPFTSGYIADTFAAYPEIPHSLIRLFEARFGPDGDEGTEAEIRVLISDHIDRVSSLDQDRILRGFLGLIDATVRTNAYRPGSASLSFKLQSSRVPEMPEPVPVHEIFVYAPDVAGVHLRGGAVARGGIRWSVRREDYRTEVLGLMKAQMTKNVVIVPKGAKGGFVMRRSADSAGPDLEEVKAGYQTFIRGLLDLTDDLVAGEAERPTDVVTHDGADPYLVVAADRGTAKFSDMANEISADYGFWLDDAFASGGSEGYDHKKLGITARGAWESVRRHFLELGVDVDIDEITVVGIGDMSGDVFGNGMLLSSNIRLVAAFDHRHIFIDPDPDPKAGYVERDRLFGLPRSSWDDYDRSLISPGGGVYRRTAKRIELSPQAQEALGTDKPVLTPNEVIDVVLRAPVDLLWNGGIGTYVKASGETHEQVQDKANDGLRVNGKQLRCRVVGEGGNLGFTQPGRIEYGRTGGRIFTDFIDNSGGVHCSDKEVNLKILLGLAEARGEIDRTERNELIQAVAGDVVGAIVYDNFLQAQILSQEAAASGQRIDAYEDLMVQLEGDGLLDREIEFLPSTETMLERAREGGSMARPELAVLLAYAKEQLSDALLASDLPDWPYFEDDLLTYFPAPVVERFGDLIADHPLRREIISTVVSNQMLNSLGSTFVTRLEAETGAGAAEIVRAYRVAREVTGAGDRWRAVEELGNEIAPEILRMLLADIDDFVEIVARWYLFGSRDITMAEEIGAFHAGFEELASEIREIGPAAWRTDRDAEAQSLMEAGVPEDLALRHPYQQELVHGPDIIEVAARSGRTVLDVARVFFRIGQVFRLDWLESQLESLPAATRWQRWAIQTLETEMLAVRRRIAERVLEGAEGRSVDVALDAFFLEHADEDGRLARFLRLLTKDGVSDTASVVVALRQLRALTG
jgi:glutamate dehydrogenase